LIQRCVIVIYWMAETPNEAALFSFGALVIGFGIWQHTDSS
jgi:hypothetical protein